MPKIFLTNEDKTLHHNEQVLTDAEKAQARENIGLGSLATKSTVEKGDLASDVQTSLDNADTALQLISTYNDVAVSQLRKEFAVGDTVDEISNVTEWTTATSPSGFNARQRACCYGNGYYVIAGTSGQMVYSKDGVNWTLVTAFTTQVITGLAYGNGRFVAVDSSGNIFSVALPDDTWEQVYTNPVIIESVRYLNNRFVAVGEGGFFATSLDAISWSKHTVPTTSTLIDSAYGNGYYIAVGHSGTVIRSINLRDWEDYSITDFGDIRTALFVGNGFVIGGQSGKIAHSADGATWAMATNNTTSSVNWIRAFAYAEKRIYAVMYISTGAGEIWVSKDGGATWTVDKSVAGRLWCVVHGDGRFVTSGDSGAIYVLDLGIEWMDEEPSSGVSTWYRYIAMLSNGDNIISESYKINSIIDETDPTVPAWAKASTPPSYTANDISGLGSLATKSTVEKSDLASDVQTSLGKADTALQSYTETDPTVPAWAKAATKPTYTAAEVGAAEEGHTHPEQVSFHGIITAGDGSTYTATVAGIDALTAGASFIMIPNVTSTVVTPKLNVNSLGEKNIRRRVSNSTVTTVAASSANWLYANKPIRMTYDGTYWIADLDRPNATDIYGTVPISSGGTGATTAASALTNLGLTATADELNYCDGVTSNIQTQLNTLSSEIANKQNAISTENWTFTLEDGSTVTKAVYVG